MQSVWKLLLPAALGLMSATAAQAIPAIGVLNNTSLFDFDTTAVSFNNQRVITGLTGTLTSIDYRPATGALYGLTTTGGLYTINVTTGAATLASQLSTALSGTSFDISFNPTVDRLRIVSNNGQNLRVNVDTGAVTVDAALNRGGTVATGIVAAAYTNQVAGATSTTLYDIDSTGNGSLNIQNPPNDGTLTTVGPTGNTIISFDIDGATNTGYVASTSFFGTIDLTTGTATVTGSFGAAGVTDFALNPVAVPTAVPEPLSMTLLGTGLVGAILLRRRAVGVAA